VWTGKELLLRFHLIKVVCVLVLAACALDVVASQRPGPRRGARQMPADPAPRDHPPLPRDRGTKLGRGLEAVGLTPQQRQAMKRIRDENDGPMRALGRRILQAHRAFDDSTWVPNIDVERARQAGKALAAVEGERIAARTGIEFAVVNLLTREQRAELRRIREQRAMESAGDPVAAPPAGPGPVDAPPPAEAVDTLIPDAVAAPEPPEPPPASTRDAGPLPRRMGGARPAPMLRLFRELELSPEQRQRFIEIRRKYAPVLHELTDKERNARRAVDEALLREDLDPAVARSLVKDLASVHVERLNVRFAAELDLRLILHPGQVAHYRELRERRRGKPDFEAPPPPGHPPGVAPDGSVPR
jgi:Spy/CpxP family protein refolding chaperone